MTTDQLETDIHSKQDERAGLLDKVARVIGSTLGTVASKTGRGSGPSDSPKPRLIDGKYQKSGNHRLPRKLKKLMQKRAAVGQGAGSPARSAVATSHRE